jgi:hypothetical protein
MERVPPLSDRVMARLTCPSVRARAYTHMLILHTPCHQTFQAALVDDLRTDNGVKTQKSAYTECYHQRIQLFAEFCMFWLLERFLKIANRMG